MVSGPIHVATVVPSRPPGLRAQWWCLNSQAWGIAAPENCNSCFVHCYWKVQYTTTPSRNSSYSIPVITARVGVLLKRLNIRSRKYDTILDAILTCARKPIWVSLIYRPETTTKKCKTEELKRKKTDMLRSNSKQSVHYWKRERENPCSSPEEKMKRLRWEAFA